MNDQTLDLGELAGPVLVFGGLYSNLEATEALLAEAAARGVPPSHMICTGDVVAYCGDPQATVDRVREAGIAVLAGNVEQQVAADAEDCACGYNTGSACDVLSVTWYNYARQAVDTDTKAWMATLPAALRFTLDGQSIAAVHGAPSHTSRHLFASADDETLAAEIDLTACDGIAAGHSGLPFVRVVDGRLWLNAGVVGMPANDGTPRVWYAVVDIEAGGISVALRALDYEYRTAAAKMRSRGLPGAYADALETGLWPDMDILPAAQRAVCGIPITPNRTIWRPSRRAVEKPERRAVNAVL